MAGEGSSSVGKCPSYHDLDVVDWKELVATPLALEFPVASNTQFGQSSTSEGKKMKIITTHEKNLNYPPKNMDVLLGKWPCGTTAYVLQFP
jgi:hypothetical protein